MTKQTKRRRSKKRRPDFFKKNKYWLILMGIAGLIVVSLVMFARQEEQPRPPVVPPVVKPVIDYNKKMHAEIEALISAQTDASVQRDLDQQPARYSVESDFPSDELIAGFRQRLARFPGNYSVVLSDVNALVVRKSRQPQAIVQFNPPVIEFPAGPLITIIMDDLGRSTYKAEALASLEQHVTFSILPGETHAAKVAEIAHNADREVMLHVPMEPQGYPAVNPGEDALFVEYSDDEIRRRFEALLAKIPYVIGANNHMGSRFTEDARALAPVMKSLSEKGMFFIDSRTTGQSRVSDVARNYDVPTLNRDVFLDNVAEVGAITKQLNVLEAKARQRGMAIGICHPYPETLEALRNVLPEFAKRGITFVPVSLLLQKQKVDQGS